MKRYLLLLATVVLATGSLAVATEPAKEPAPPPEVKKTVDALAGRWKLATTMSLPGVEKPLKFVEKFDCKKVSGGRGVLCSDVSAVPGMGTMDFTHLVAYDPERKQVHWFAVGSTGEVHDHPCAWKDDKTLACEPLKATMGGKPITETVTITFDGAKTTMTGTINTSDGDVKFESTGKRSGG